MAERDRQLQEANEAFDRENYVKAARLYALLADEGVVEAQRNLGTLFQLGLGVERNLIKGVELLETAAASGDGIAAHNLGTIYLTGEPELPPDPIKSKKWYQRAKDLGFVAANPEWYGD